MAEDKKWSRFLQIVVFVCLLSVFMIDCHDGRERRVNIILIGVTGDLSKRYLLQAIFDLYKSVKKADEFTSLRFYGAARSLDKKDGDIALQSIIKTSLKCEANDHECNNYLTEFSEISTYWQLKKDEDYAKFQEFLENTIEITGTVEVGRIFYLSVPPFSYEQISRIVSESCRPSTTGAWFRVILEKPFGTDLDSAKDLDQKLSKYLNEEEVYRIDHYLGKTGVRQIAELRQANVENLEAVWNNHFIDKVEIVVKERLDVSGRMKFYDHYGAIRDMFQNHLTEILVLLTTELSNDSSSNNVQKSKVLESVRIVTPDKVLFGQYEQYNSQLQQEIPSKEAKSNTPTFAAVTMFIDNARWAGVPFVLMSGKSLDTRLAFVRVTFKRNTFCIIMEKCRRASEIVFYIQGDMLAYPVTMVSQGLPPINLPRTWKNTSNKSFPITNLINSQTKLIMQPPLLYNSYSMLIQDVFKGNKEMFLDIKNLFLSWKVWTPLLDTSTTISPKIYNSNNIEVLDFEIVKKGKLKFIADTASNCDDSYFKNYKLDTSSVKLASFRGDQLLSGPFMNVVLMLGNTIKVAALSKVKTDGQFHLALSGGKTPLLLFQVLAFSMEDFPWQQTHVWFVDERCVSLTDRESNYNSIYQSLLKHVDIPLLNIHPMLVEQNGKLCEKNIDSEYESSLRYYFNDSVNTLDFVVLGVGQDGHTASLFPYQKSINSSKWVELTKGSPPFEDRVSLTLNILNRSKQIGLMVQGADKHKIIKELSTGIVDVDRLPITGVKPVNGGLSWYIGNKALESG